jgi:cytoskeletal protein CcmA (bactofilin family)
MCSLRNLKQRHVFHAGLPVKGTIEGDVKGGYEVRIGRRLAACAA